MILALIELGFDPLLRIGQLTIRWQTVGVTVALLAALGVAALMAPGMGAQRPYFRRGRPDLRPLYPNAPQVDHTGAGPSGRPLRLDDMLLIVAAIVPGAVIGGRIVHGLVFWGAYAGQPQMLLNPLVGTLSLLGAVLGGLLSAIYMARLIGAPVRRWADAAAVPLLFAIGLGKLAQLLGGSGQGLPFEGSWAVAFTGAGPWVSLNAQLPAHPAQVYEGLWLLVGIPLVLLLAGARHRPLRVNSFVAWADRSAAEGLLFLATLAWFLLGRVIVGFTWRDEPVVGGLNMEQLLALVCLAATLILAARVIVVRKQGSSAATPGANR